MGPQSGGRKTLWIQAGVVVSSRVSHFYSHCIIVQMVVSVNLKVTQWSSLGVLFSKVKPCGMGLISGWVTKLKNSCAVLLGKWAWCSLINFYIHCMRVEFQLISISLKGFLWLPCSSRLSPLWQDWYLDGWPSREKFWAVLLGESGWCSGHEVRVVYNHCIWAEFQPISMWLVGFLWVLTGFAHLLWSVTPIK